MTVRFEDRRMRLAGPTPDTALRAIGLMLFTAKKPQRQSTRISSRISSITRWPNKLQFSGRTDERCGRGDFGSSHPLRNSCSENFLSLAPKGSNGFDATPKQLFRIFVCRQLDDARIGQDARGVLLGANFVDALHNASHGMSIPYINEQHGLQYHRITL